MIPNSIQLKKPALAGRGALSDEALAVRDILIKNGLETPMIDNALTAEEKCQRIKELMAEVMVTLGLDLADDSLIETPHRIAKMYVYDIFSGLDYSSFRNYP